MPRYQTMRGRHVERRFGWDTHGLPAETETEKQLGLKNKAEIDELGVAAFNAACRESVLRYTDEWRAYVTRQARWVDFDNDYKTLDLDYMESVMWAFKTLWDKGLVYQGFRVLWYCWHDGTPLSATETKMDDVYLDRQDPAVTVGLRLSASGDLDGAAGPGLDDHAVDPAVQPRDGGQPGRRLRAGRGERRALRPRRRPPRRVRPGAGGGADRAADLPRHASCSACPTRRRSTSSSAGRTRTACSPPTTSPPRTAPASSTSRPRSVRRTRSSRTRRASRWSCRSAPTARSTPPCPPYEGMLVFDANHQIIRDLKERTKPFVLGVLLRHDTYDHPYPHCWRCGNPLIQRAVDSWFVQVTAFRDRMVELNREITWVPAHIKDGQFGKWLENAIDWSISRNRYWGSPIPVWMSDDPAYPRTDVYGSLDELERDFGVRPTDLHRPFVDDLTRPNPDDPTGRSTMRRVPEVLDCWFESGSMPFAQVHYPFENAEWFEHHYPGDFIVEYNGQTRGWFYTLHVLATALFDRPSFASCVAHGIVLGDDGLKMSKSRKNYPDVNEVFDRDGSDAMRWFLMASPILRGGNLIVTEQGIREGGAPGDPAAVEHLVLPVAVRRRGRAHGHVPHRLAARARPVRSGPHGGARRGRHGRDGRLRHRGRVRAGARPRRGAHQLVRPPLPRPVLGRRRRRGRHAAHGAGGARRGSRPRCCR